MVPRAKRGGFEAIEYFGWVFLHYLKGIKKMPDSSQIQVSIPTPSWRKSKWLKNSLWIAGTILVLYAMVYVDVVLRAKDAYREGEKYWRWHEHPEEKSSTIDAEFNKEKLALDEKLSRNKLTKDEHERQLEIAKFDRDRNLEESSIKYAYVWYKTAFELFSPPESKWVRLSREKAPLAREKWKDELRSKKIPFEEYMLD